MNKNGFKNICIIILLSAVIILCAIKFVNIDYSTVRQNFFTQAMGIQSRVSEYLGKRRFETFGVYSDFELLAGDTLEKDKNDEELAKMNLPKLIDKEAVLEIKDKKFYKLSIATLQKELKVSVLVNDVDWYIGEDGIIKIDFKRKPEWWSEEYNVFYVRHIEEVNVY